jgi:Rap1a immunity proteins
MRFSNSITCAIAPWIGCVACAFAADCARALPANELLQSCEAVVQTIKTDAGDMVDISPAGLPCWYYISAVQNMTSLTDEADGRLLHICPPSDTTILDFVRVFVQHAREANPNVTGGENAAPLVFTALVKAYPCGERP